MKQTELNFNEKVNNDIEDEKSLDEYSCNNDMEIDNNYYYIPYISHIQETNPILELHNDDENLLPKQGTSDSAGLDLYSNEDYCIKPKQRMMISTGNYIDLSSVRKTLNLPYYNMIEGSVRPRSGLAIKHGITVLNAPGTIDEDYRGEVKVLLYNTSDKEFIISKGDRIAQLVISTCLRVNILNKDLILSDTERGSGGFGHTGTREIINENEDDKNESI